jgi:hypothetical protein
MRDGRVHFYIYVDVTPFSKTFEHLYHFSHHVFYIERLFVAVESLFSVSLVIFVVLKLIKQHFRRLRANFKNVLLLFVLLLVLQDFDTPKN